LETAKQMDLEPLAGAERAELLRLRKRRADDPDRFVTRVGQVVGLRGRNNSSLDLVGGPGEVPVPVEQCSHLSGHFP